MDQAHLCQQEIGLRDQGMWLGVGGKTARNTENSRDLLGFIGIYWDSTINKRDFIGLNRIHGISCDLASANPMRLENPL